MATSNVHICNEALTLLGASTIISLTAATENARRCNMIFGPTRDALVRKHRWRFAINRATLARSSDAPAYGYDYAFQLPTDPYCLRVLELYEERDDGADWQIEGRTLATDSDTARIKYLGRVTDPNQFDESFREALVYELAAKLAIPITHSRTLGEDMRVQAEGKIAEAEEMNAIESYSDEDDLPIEGEGDWVSER
jgi:hypothetical protein